MAKQGFKSSTNVVLQPRNMSGQAQPAGVPDSVEFDNIHEISRYIVGNLSMNRDTI